MVTMDKFQTGVVNFIDRELAPSLTGWDRVIVAGCSGLIAANLPNIVSKYSNNPVMEAIGVYDAENNLIDIDAIYNAASQYIGTERLPLKIPAIGISIKLGKPELDSLYRYIKEA